DSYPLTRILDPMEEPLELSPGVSSSSNVTMLSRFADYQLSDRKAVQIVLWYLDSGCSRHMTGDHSKLINFVEKFIGTVRFGNDDFAKIVGYGDYKLGGFTSRFSHYQSLLHLAERYDVRFSSLLAYKSTAISTTEAEYIALSGCCA
nr:retrovirus-related Pol polyprotein from transposon TNT 1-94 [Tanacetum cinerariifolium]